MYQWTAIDECSRVCFVMGFEEHTPENSVKFLDELIKRFPFEALCVQTDNGTEFTYKYISDKEKCPFEKRLSDSGIEHRQIKPCNHGIMGRCHGFGYATSSPSH